MTTERKFLTRVEATHRLGLFDAGLRREPQGVKVACLDQATGTVYEAEPGEFLHAQIFIRVAYPGCDLVAGWTVEEESGR